MIDSIKSSMLTASLRHISLLQGTNAHVILETPASTANSAVISTASAPQRLAWSKARLWPLPAANQLISSFTSSTTAFEVNLCSSRLAFLWDHLVGGRVVFPGAAYVEMAAAATTALLLPSSAGQAAAVALAGVTIPAPLVLPAQLTAKHVSSQLFPRLVCSLDARTGQLQIRSVQQTLEAASQLHMMCTAAAVTQPASTAFARHTESTYTSRALLQSTMQPAVAAALQEAAAGTQPCMVAALAPASLTADGTLMHPAVLDSCLQLGAVPTSVHASVTLRVPAGMELVLLPTGNSTQDQPSGPNSSSSSTLQQWASVAPAASSSSPKTSGAVCLDYHMAGSVNCSIAGLTAKPITIEALQQPQSISSGAVAAAPSKQQDTQMLYDTVWLADSPYLESASGMPVTCQLSAAASEQHTAAAVSTSAAALAVLQAAALAEMPGVTLQIPDCTAVSDGPCGALSLAPAAQLLGLAKSAAQELPSTQITTDITSATAQQSIKVSLGGSDTGSVWGIMQGSAIQSVPRLVPAVADNAQQPMQLLPSPRGSFSSLVPQPVQLTDLQPGQLGVQVAAVGINFRDVLNVLGMYPGDPGAPGSDVAGVVVAGSSGVLRPGQAVFGLAVGALGTAVACSAETVVAMPPCLSFEAASSMPTVFITAQMALGAVTGLTAGERVLVHAAAGGVGLAALQVVSAVGASAVATAGSPSKRSLLRSLGVSSVVGSRDSVFVGPVCCLGGVDVVLNSLTSPGMVGGSLAVLKQGGRFVEIGKRDIWAPAAAAAERPDVSYSLLAVDFLPGSVVQSALQRVAAGVAAGRLAPLPTVSYSLVAAAAALRQMSQARHVGKVVVSRRLSSQPCHRLGRVVVTGGLGALGSLVAEWLCGHGVSQLQLLGRVGKLRGSSSLEQLLSSSSGSSQVIISQCDAGSSEDLAAALYSTSGSLPVELIIHAGGVLADATLQQQHLHGVQSVVGAKMSPVGALLRACEQQPVRSVVLFSSVASLLGSPGQSNYAAANAGLDAAARAGQVCGLPAVSVQWGAWSGGGMAASDAQTAARVERMGMSLISPAAGLAALEGVLGASVARHRPVVAATPFLWDRFLARLPAVPAFFSAVAPAAKEAAAVGDAAAGQAAGAAPAPAGGISMQGISSKVSAAVAAVVGKELTAEDSLMESGLDSLGAVELRNALASTFAMDLPATLVSKPAVRLRHALLSLLCFLPVGADYCEQYRPLRVLIREKMMCFPTRCLT
jgi:NADPH:quinone reductase-like Zn-dependent oxidoreductase/acyl carrier protein